MHCNKRRGLYCRLQYFREDSRYHVHGPLLLRQWRGRLALHPACARMRQFSSPDAQPVSQLQVELTEVPFHVSCNCSTAFDPCLTDAGRFVEGRIGLVEQQGLNT